MMRARHSLVLAVVGAALAACPSPRIQGGVPEVPTVSPVPGPNALELCQVTIVGQAPAGADRVGTVQMPANPGQDRIVDPDAMQVACGLRARWAVTEQAYVDDSGQLMWNMGLYRAVE